MKINDYPTFVDAFSEYSENYVIIGGTATVLQLAQVNISSRTTKDYELVLIDEKNSKDFYDALKGYLYAGKYIGEEIFGQNNLYRFETEEENYPKQIELFSKHPSFQLELDNRKAPIRFEEDSSLSALLLDDEYYEVLLKHIEKKDGYSILSVKGLIVFKAKAWMDLSKRREHGEAIQSRNIKKHFNDIFRLIGALDNTEPVEDIPVSVKEDMKEFIKTLLVTDIPVIKDIGLTPIESYEIIKELLG